MNWRSSNDDQLDPESPANFDISSLLPSIPSVSASEVQTLSSQIRQLLRGGDSEGALRGALENAPYGGDAQAKVSRSPPFKAARKRRRGSRDSKQFIKVGLFIRPGSTSSDGSRNAAVQQTIRDVAPA